MWLKIWLVNTFRNLFSRILWLRETEGEERRRTESSAFIEYSNDPVFSVAPDGVFQHLNNSAARLFGVSAEDYQGKTVHDLFPPDAAKQYMQMIHRVYTTGDPLKKRAQVLIQSAKQWFENVMIPLKDSHGNVVRIVWSAKDITDNVRINEQLNNERNKFEKAFSHAAIGKGLATPNGRIITVNQALCSILGYSQNELQGMSWRELAHPDYQEKLLANFTKILNGEHASFFDEIRLVHKDGTDVWVDLNLVLIRDGDDRPLCFVGDIVDRTKQKKALEWNSHLNSVLQAIRSINKLITQEKDLHQLLREACKALVRNHGYSSAWIGLLNYDGTMDVAYESGLGPIFTPLKQQLAVGELNECARRALAQSGVICIENPESECFDCPMLGKESNRRSLATRLTHNGRTYGIISVSIPAEFAPLVPEHELLTEVANDLAFALDHIELEQKRREMERQLKEREEIFRSISTAAQDAIIMMDHKGRISFWNEAARKIFGYSASEVIGKDLHALLVPEDLRQSFLSSFPRFLETGEGNFIGSIVECESITKDGSRIVVELSLSSMQLFNQWHAVGIIRDITDRRRKEKELREAKEHAERSEQFKDAFIANISHEIRTPLNVILGYTGVIADVFPENFSDEVRPFLENIENAGMRLMRTVDSIVNISRMQVGDIPFKVSLVDVNVLLEEIIEKMRDLAQQKQLDLLFRTTVDYATIDGDAFLLSLVFDNVIDNAIKYTNKGSVIVHLFKNQNNALVIEVSDTGIGISEDYLPVIFEPYTQEEIGYSRTYEGIGLGLSLTQKVIELHRGTITVQSRKDKGTTFTITFPADIVHQLNAHKIETASNR